MDQIFEPYRRAPLTHRWKNAGDRRDLRGQRQVVAQRVVRHGRRLPQPGRGTRRTAPRTPVDHRLPVPVGDRRQVTRVDRRPLAGGSAHGVVQPLVLAVARLQAVGVYHTVRAVGWRRRGLEGAELLLVLEGGLQEMNDIDKVDRRKYESWPKYAVNSEFLTC